MYFSKSAFYIALISSGIIFNPTAMAQAIESIENKYYEISPRAPYEIKQELMRQSPIRGGSGSYNGHTDWYINWSFQAIRELYGCQATQIQTRVHVVHILPSLSARVTDPQTIEAFNKFNAALTAHEKNHGSNGRLAAREIDKALNEVQPQRDCQSLSRVINNIGNHLVQKYTAKDNEYDRTTNNGFTEGAVIY
ncbi:MAG: DUF922 domain-containing protein [Gammaproteobacteria bacterium]|nr:DUF922 domain-containing protein [Gammaproteobacteria bacterium]